MNAQPDEQPTERLPVPQPAGLQVPFDAVLTEIVKRINSPAILWAIAVIILLFVGLFLVPDILDKAPALPWGVLGFGLIVLLLFVAPQAYFQAREQARQEWREREKARRLAKAARARREKKQDAGGAPSPAVSAPQPAAPLLAAPSLPSDPDALRELYLREVFADCRDLKLHTIDIRTATGAREAAELELAAVFTDLDVIERVHKEDWERGRHSDEAMEKPETRLPALAALSRYKYMVLLGDPGSGKSTLVSFVALCLAGDGLADPDINLKRLGKAWSLP
ncbi:MAG: hypothetical protein U9R15_12145, partial [Chloroflexota bacterium]|nr:hypothetical protein [Chloroflexota bacterium]